MKRSFARWLGPVAVALLVATAPAQQVFFPQPGSSPIASLQAAIDAAADGDILVLGAGWAPEVVPFGGVILAGKGLTLVAASGSQPGVGRLEIRDVPAGSRVVLRGLRFSSPVGGLVQTTELATVRIDDCAGSVWLEDCELVGLNGLEWMFGFSGDAYHAISVRHAAAVNLERCTLSGGNGANQGGGGMSFHPASNGGAGADLMESAVCFRSCKLTGGAGGLGFGVVPTKADVGLRASGGVLLLVDCEVLGGQDLNEHTWPNAGLVADASAAIALRDVLIVAGAGEPVAPDVSAPPEIFTTFVAPPRSLVLPTPLHEQEAGVLHLQGQPGDMLFVFTSYAGSHQLLPGKQGVFSLGAQVLGPFLLGFVTSPDGKLDLPFTAPDLVGAQTEGWTTLLQLASASGGKALLEGTSSFVLLDASLP